MKNDKAVMSFEEARALRERLDGEGRKLVFTNGCFDVLHVGHVRYLKEARALGDALLIGLNGDNSVRRLKGEGRPVNTAEDRAEILLALDCVDAVVVFEEDRATRVIEGVQPHAYAKGGDYTVESLHPEERAALKNAGTAIEILPLVPGKSTSATLKRMGSGGGGRLRLGILGSGKGSNFDAIAAAIDAGQLDAEVALVLSDVADAGIVEKAKARGVATVVVDPGASGGRLAAAAEKEMRDRLVAAQVDLVVMAGFMRIVGESLLGSFPERVLNVHPSLLPAFKGRDAWGQALAAGVSETGCTVHRVNAEIDSGEILAQAKVSVEPGDTVESLRERIHEQEHLLYPRVIAEVGAALRDRT